MGVAWESWTPHLARAFQLEQPQNAVVGSSCMSPGGHYLIKLLSCLQLFAHAKGLRQCQDLGAWRNLALFFFFLNASRAGV